MTKDFDKWNEIKKKINEKETKIFCKLREIWWCSLGLNIGDEEDGKNNLYERPILILCKFNYRIVLCIPLTTKPKINKFNFIITHEQVSYSFLISQIRLISTKRLNRRIRIIGSGLFEEILKKIKKFL